MTTEQNQWHQSQYRSNFKDQVFGKTAPVMTKTSRKRWSTTDRNNGDLRARKEQENIRKQSVAAFSKETSAKHDAGRQSDAERMKAIFG